MRGAETVWTLRECGESVEDVALLVTAGDDEERADKRGFDQGSGDDVQWMS